MRRNEYRIDPRSYELILDKWPEKKIQARTEFEPKTSTILVRRCTN